MMNFNCKSKNELLRYTGALDQIAGIKRYTFNSGMEKGIAAIEVRNGSGLNFTVLESKNMDIYQMEYKGINLGFYYKNRMVAPERFVAVENEFLAYAGGGMMYTTGLQNSGPANTDEGLYQPLHGRIHAMSADNIFAEAAYDESGIFRIKVGGRTRESRLFGHNLTLARTISTEMDSNTIEIKDLIENETCRDTFFSLMYHFNFGYPFLDEDTEIILPPKTQTATRTESSKKYFAERYRMSKPIDNFEEHLYYHDIPADTNGMSHILVVNKKLTLAVHIQFNKNVLPFMGEWKSMGSGDYALGILPATNLLRGRQEEKAARTLTSIPAFSSVAAHLLFTVLDSDTEIEKLAKTIQAMF
ncbi:DUF4432 family protein [Treponema phagedenis]|uniref:DUF4432 family protein n=1 Tax=Treponema phagedenis TaxID=162 RepID=A0A0B7GT34_TREPH|nr:aldose 1-epimerase family protein [Treponema phagedenis]NVP23850.1 aldose 1-epimerase family protein [Treponema phagedenis]QEJ96342.1 DUF4432 family protein [Treponema phagedenis]QEJ99501.1 DUF4432 family protein [Treponema phagedenis]QEK02140.1 DUF4432 family protein [Treponema phagedenis]QEK05072.1 DUF4432 family protein [Treponema phagedenis]